MPQQPALAVNEQKLNDVWNEHLRRRVLAHSAHQEAGRVALVVVVNCRKENPVRSPRLQAKPYFSVRK